MNCNAHSSLYLLSMYILHIVLYLNTERETNVLAVWLLWNLRTELVKTWQLLTVASYPFMSSTVCMALYRYCKYYQEP